MVGLTLVRSIVEEAFHGIHTFITHDVLQFDEAVSESVLLKIIRELEKVDVKVVAVISDMGPKNMRLWRELGISIDSPSLANPADASR